MRRLWTAAQMGTGLVMVGAAGYVFVAVVDRVFEVPRQAAQVSALATLYLLVNVIGPGLFSAVEQETNRAVSTSLAAGRPAGPAARRAAALTLGLLVALFLVLALLWSPVLSRVLDGRVGLLLSLALAGAGAAAAYWVRGVLAAQLRFGAYAATLHLEGGVRLLATGALVVVGVTSPGAYGAAFAAGAGVAGLALLPSAWPGGGSAASGELTGMRRSLLLLVSATLLGQAVANLAPVVVAYRLPDDLVRVSTFTASFVLARVPLFLFAPVQSLLLPSLTRAATQGRPAEVRHQVRRVLLAVLAVGVPGAVAATVLGPQAVRSLFNAPSRPPAVMFAVLGAATLLMMCVQVLQAALVALRGQRAVSLLWAAGTAVFLAVLTTAPGDPLRAALAAQLLGPALVAGGMAAALVQRLRSAPPVPARSAAPVGPR